MFNRGMEQKEDTIIGNYKTLILGVVIFLTFITILGWLIPSLNDDSLINSFFYFFSASAQTMGALVAIVLSSIYALSFNLKTVDVPYSEPMRRLFLKDKHLLNAIYLSLLMIIISIFGTLVTKNVSISSFYIVFSITLIISTIVLGIFGVSELLVFLFKRASLYSNPTLIIANDIESVIAKDFDPKYVYPLSKVLDYAEISLFHECLKSPNIEKFHLSRYILANRSSTDITNLKGIYSAFFKKLEFDLDYISFSSLEKEKLFFKELFIGLFYTCQISKLCEGILVDENIYRDLFLKKKTKDKIQYLISLLKFVKDKKECTEYNINLIQILEKLFDYLKRVIEKRDIGATKGAIESLAEYFIFPYFESRFVPRIIPYPKNFSIELFRKNKSRSFLWSDEHASNYLLSCLQFFCYSLYMNPMVDGLSKSSFFDLVHSMTKLKKLQDKYPNFESIREYFMIIIFEEATRTIYNSLMKQEIDDRYLLILINQIKEITNQAEWVFSNSRYLYDGPSYINYSKILNKTISDKADIICRFLANIEANFINLPYNNDATYLFDNDTINSFQEPELQMVIDIINDVKTNTFNSNIWKLFQYGIGFPFRQAMNISKLIKRETEEEAFVREVYDYLCNHFRIYEPQRSNLKKYFDFGYTNNINKLMDN